MVQVIPADQEQKLAMLRGCPYFAELAEQILLELAQGVWLRFYEAEEVIFWEGETSTGLHVIQQGSAKLFKLSPNGRELIIRVLEDQDSFNEVPVFDYGTNPVSASVLEESEVWLIEADVIRRAMERHPEMCRSIIANLTRNLRMLVDKVEELTFFQVTNRLARLLLQLPEDRLSGSAPQRITQDQLAARLGTVREVVARSLGELQRAGAISVRRRKITIHSAEILQMWAQGTAEYPTRMP